MQYLNPQPSEERVRAFYDREFFEEKGTYEGRYCETHGKYLQPVWVKALQYLTRQFQGGRLLDVGCAHGFFLRAAAGFGLEAHGVELVPEAAGHARALGFPVHTGDLRSAAFPDASFKIVTMLDVLEHVPRPVEELREVRRVLEPDGMLCILTPNARQSRVLGHRWRGYQQSFTHLLFLEPGSLARLLRAAGFEPVHMFTVQQNLELPLTRKFGRMLEVSYTSVSKMASVPFWKRAARTAWYLANRASFCLPERLLFGHMLCVFAVPSLPRGKSL